MTMDHLNFFALNLSSSDAIPNRDQLSDYFTLSAPPATSIWRVPHSDSTITAPMLLTCLPHPFVLAEVTISADFEMEWDQGGLVIFAGSSPALPTALSPVTRRRRRQSRSYSENDTEAPSGGKWVKAGLQFTGDTLNVSSVVSTSDTGADWSLSPILPTSSTSRGVFSPGLTSLRIKLERVGDGLWIWYRDPNVFQSYLSQDSPQTAGAVWRKLREVTGFFCGVEDKGGVWVGCYASRPILYVPGNSWEDASAPLQVDFEELEIL